jgi:hypothetical protein
VTPSVVPAAVAPAASEAPVEEEPESHDEELLEVVDDEPTGAYEPITREDVADEAEPVVEPAPVEEHRLEIGGPEIDVDEPRVTVRSVDTVSAIDLVMGVDEPTEDRSSADDPPVDA